MESAFSVYDAAEQHVFAEVRREVPETVRQKLLEEFDQLVQAEVTKALAEIIFRSRTTGDPLTRAMDVHVLIQWLKCREEKKRFRAREVVEEVQA